MNPIVWRQLIDTLRAYIVEEGQTLGTVSQAGALQALKLIEGEKAWGKYVYVAGPYSIGDLVQNTAEAIRAADVLVNEGFIPYVPHLSMFWHFLCQHPVGFWYRLDIEWLKKCNYLLRIPGESVGADREVDIARACHIPIYYTVKELVEAAR